MNNCYIGLFCYFSPCQFRKATTYFRVVSKTSTEYLNTITAVSGHNLFLNSDYGFCKLQIFFDPLLISLKIQKMF